MSFDFVSPFDLFDGFFDEHGSPDYNQILALMLESVTENVSFGSKIVHAEQSGWLIAATAEQIFGANHPICIGPIRVLHTAGQKLLIQEPSSSRSESFQLYVNSLRGVAAALDDCTRKDEQALANLIKFVSTILRWAEEAGDPKPKEQYTTVLIRILVDVPAKDAFLLVDEVRGAVAKVINKYRSKVAAADQPAPASEEGAAAES